MILVDSEIRAYIECLKIGILPFEDGCVNPSSYDLHLGSHFQLAVETKLLDPRSEQSIRDNFTEMLTCQIIVEPGGFILGTSVERVIVPPDCVGMVVGKSSIARLGWEVENAGLLDPGFCGEVTFEIVNNHISPILLYAGMPFAQLVFFPVKACENHYGERETSKYQHQHGATISRYHLNQADE